MRIFTIILALLLASSAHAVDTQLITHLDDLWLRSGITSNSTLYGPSNSAGTWLAYQWSNSFPNGTQKPDAFPFQSIQCETVGNTNCFRAYAQDIKFNLFTNSGNRVVRIATAGQNQPCYPGTGLGGAPYEQDAFVGPNIITGYPPGILSKPNLGSLTALTVNFTLNVKTANMNTSGGCPIILPAASQQTALIVAWIFSSTGGQTFYYQLAIGRFGFFQPARAFNTSSAPAYLYSDNPLSYPNANFMGAGTVQGLAYAVNQPIVVSLNILPVLSNLITTGGGGLDPVLADWTLNSFYFGHATYGNIGLITEWSNISLVGSQ